MKTFALFSAIYFSAAFALFSDQATYVNQGLDRETIVSLENQNGKILGFYRQHGDEGESPIEAKFIGKIIESPAGKKGAYREIQFKGPVPYDTKEGKIIWCLRVKNDDKKLYMPILGRDFTTQPPKIKSCEMELEALPENFEGD
jgi:hypothetical protein